MKEEKSQDIFASTRKPFKDFLERLEEEELHSEYIEAAADIPPWANTQTVQVGHVSNSVMQGTRWMKLSITCPETQKNLLLVLDYKKFRQWAATNFREARVYDRSEDNSGGDSWDSEIRLINCSCCDSITKFTAVDRFQIGSALNMAVYDLWKCSICSRITVLANDMEGDRIVCRTDSLQFAQLEAMSDMFPKRKREDEMLQDFIQRYRTRY